MGLEKSLEESLTGSELVNTGLDITEIAIDQLLNEGLLKEVPVVKSLIALVKTGYSIRDALYIKKVLLFVLGVQEVSEEKRLIFLKDISQFSKEKNRLLEKIFITLDKIDDSEKAILLAKAFQHLIVGNIDKTLYYRIARIIEDMLLDDIYYFFYAYGQFNYEEESVEKYKKYSSGNIVQNLIPSLVRNGLIEFNEELKTKGIMKMKYVHRNEKITQLGKIFVEIGYKTNIYLKHPIN